MTMIQLARGSARGIFVEGWGGEDRMGILERESGQGGHSRSVCELEFDLSRTIVLVS